MADSDDFDVYYMWLGISPEERPAHHYRLLDVKVFESNADAIEMGYNRRMLYLRSIKDGDRLDEAQQLQNKLSEARICLLNPEKKATYDADLRRRLAHGSNPSAATPAWASPPIMAAPPPSPPAAKMPPETMHPAIMPTPMPTARMPPTITPPGVMPPRSPYAERPQLAHPRPQASTQSPYFPSVPPPMIDDLEIVDEFGGEPALPKPGTQQVLFDQTFRNNSSGEPRLIVRDAAKAIEFYTRAFGAKETMRINGPEGKIGHAEMQLGSGAFMLADEHPGMGFLSPEALGGSGVSLMFYVDDVDAQVATAVAAGAKLMRPVQDQFYGDRSGLLTDPFGNVWTIATHIEDMTHEEQLRRAAEMMKQPCAKRRSERHGGPPTAKKGSKRMISKRNSLIQYDHGIAELE